MMRKKQISRMLIGAFAAFMATGCSNETEVLNGLPTDGNTLSVNLQTNDIGAATRAIATDEELAVNNISAYLFDENGALEKAYNSLTPKESNGKYTVALTHIENRGPKTIYFVANGTGITALNDVEGFTKDDFQELMMNEMTANPETPLAMTAQAELATWDEGVNNATVDATLEHVSARIDLKVDEQAGLSFEPTKMEMAAAANSYIFPNEVIYNDDETATISGLKLYPYESAAGMVESVKVTGMVKVGETEKEATFTVPFVNENKEAIAIERNHRYTIHITRINGFFSAEATVTVSDWDAADYSGELAAGEELKMTATNTVEGADNEAGVAVYPTSETNKAEVEVAVEGDTYRIWVGSANIEAVTSWTELPEGWTIDVPATRSEYLWQKGDWTLTIPANETTEEKSFTIKAVNKLAQAKDPNTEVYVQITFTQKGKEVEEVDHSKNPLLKWAKQNSINYLQKQYGSTQQWWTWEYEYSSKDYPESTWANGIGSYYQWGRNAGFPFPTDYNPPYTNTGGISWAKVTYNLPTKATAAKTANQHLFIINGDGNDYVSDGNNSEIWTDRTSKLYNDNGTTSYDNPAPWPCPEGWRLPTTKEYLQIMPKKENQQKSFTSLTELKELEDGTKYVIRWSYSDDNPTLSGNSAWNEHLTIECLVVPQKYTESDLTSIQWSGDNVVTRIFYTGGSRLGAYYGSHSNPQSPAPVTFDWDNTAYYWTSESAPATGAAWAMTFRTSQRTDDETGNYGPWFQIAAYPKDNALLVRAVTDNPNLQEK